MGIDFMNLNCLNSKWDDVKMQAVLEDEKKLEAETHKARRCIYELHGKKINPYQLVEGMEYRECCEAVLRLTQKQFYSVMVKERYEKKFVPVHQRLMRKRRCSYVCG